MADEKEKTAEDQNKENEGKVWPLPYCTTAPSAEHFRPADEDEPCDDASGKETEGKKDQA